MGQHVPLSTLAATHGYADRRSLRRLLDRHGVAAVARQPGRAGESLYDEDEVQTVVGGRRPGARTDLGER